MRTVADVWHAFETSDNRPTLARLWRAAGWPGRVLAVVPAVAVLGAGGVWAAASSPPPVRLASHSPLQIPARVAPASPPVAAGAPDPGTPQPARAVAGRAGRPARVEVAEYPLTYQPVTMPAAGASEPGLVNPKSKPIPGYQQARAEAFPATPRQEQPLPASVFSLPAGGGVPAASALPQGSVVVRALIERFFPASQWVRAEAVSRCESGQRNVVSAPNNDGSRDYGVFQLNSGGTLQGLLARFGYPASDLAQALDASWNVEAAAALWRDRGWEPWTCAAELGFVPGPASAQ